MDARVDKLIEVVRKTVIKLFPELAGRYHLGCRASVTGLAGGLQLQPLTREGSEDASAPAVKCDPVPVKLKSGNVVRMAFLYGDPAEPVVFTRATAAVGTMAGGKVDVENYGVKDCLVAEHLRDHFRLATLTAPVDEQGNPLPGATTSPLTRIDFKAPLKDGDKVVALPIEEGERFIIVARLEG